MKKVNYMVKHYNLEMLKKLKKVRSRNKKGPSKRSTAGYE
jgi:hypothetical protein